MLYADGDDMLDVVPSEKLKERVVWGVALNAARLLRK